MAYSIENIDANSKKVQITIPADELNKVVKQKLRKLQKTVKLQGFRKGKVPMSVMQQRYGGSAYQEAISDLVDAESQKAMNDIPNVVYRSDYEQGFVQENGDFKISFTAESMPEIDLVGYLGIEATAPEIKVTEKEIEESLKVLQKQYAVLEPVEGRDVVEVGDVVVASCKPLTKSIATIPDEELSSEETTFRIEEEEDKRHPIAAALLGKSKNDNIRVEIKLNDLGYESLGPDENCTLEIKIHSIDNEVLPELNDDLALDSGLGENFEELKNFISNNITDAKKERRQQHLREQVAEELSKRFPIEIPPNYLMQQIDSQIRNELAKYGRRDALEPNFNLDTALSNIGAVRDSIKDQVENMIRRNFLAMALFRKENLQIGEDDFRDFASAQARSQRIDPTAIIKQINKDANYRNYVSTIVSLKKAFDFLADNAEVTEITEEEFEKELLKEQEARLAKLRDDAEALSKNEDNSADSEEE